MIALSFHQTKAQFMVRVASTMIFNTLQRNGYPFVPLSELAENPQYGYTAKSFEGGIEGVNPHLVRITDLQDDKIEWRSVPYCESPDSTQYLLKPNDILFARTGATTGKTHLVKEVPAPAVFASYLIRIRPRDRVFVGYLYAFFQSDSYWSQIIDQKQGSAQPNVNGQKLASLFLPQIEPELQKNIFSFIQAVRKRQDGDSVDLPSLPEPLSEQRRIVAKIEQLAAKIEEARGLRQYSSAENQSIVGNAVRHVFTKQPDKNWQSGCLGDYVVDYCYGTSEKTFDEPIGVPILRMGNIQEGTLDTRDLKYLHISPKDRDKWILRRNDIIVNRTNSAELVGKCAVFNLEGDWGFASYLIRLRLDLNRADARLVARYINSPIGREYMFRERKQMTGQANVNSKKLNSLPISLPPLDEQRRIVAYLDGLQAQVDRLKALQAQTAAELEALLPSILDQAFKGEL